MKIEAVKKGDKRVLPFKKKKGNADGWGVQTVADDGLLIALELSDSTAIVLTKAVLASFGFYYRKPKEVVVAKKTPVRSGGKSSTRRN